MIRLAHVCPCGRYLPNDRLVAGTCSRECTRPPAPVRRPEERTRRPDRLTRALDRLVAFEAEYYS